MSNLTARIKDYMYGCEKVEYERIGKWDDFDVHAIAVKEDGVKIVILVEGELKAVDANDFDVSVK